MNDAPETTKLRGAWSRAGQDAAEAVERQIPPAASRRASSSRTAVVLLIVAVIFFLWMLFGWWFFPTDYS